MIWQMKEDAHLEPYFSCGYVWTENHKDICRGGPRGNALGLHMNDYIVEAVVANPECRQQKHDGVEGKSTLHCLPPRVKRVLVALRTPSSNVSRIEDLH